MKRNIIIYIFACFVFSITLSGQEKVLVYETFKDRRVINNHSSETLMKRKLDFRIGHRFGNMLGETGGWQTFYGLDNSTDIFIGFDYGLTNNVNIGISRTKGSNELRQNINSFMKAKLMAQDKQNNPLTITVMGMTTYSTMAQSQTEGVISSFPQIDHRFSFHSQLMLARKFSPGFSLQLNGGWTYRNLVYDYDKNDLVSAGIASRIQITRVMGLIVDVTYPFSTLRTVENGYYPAIGLGFEFETGSGHVFQLNLTNATGMSETDFIPYTTSNWSEGEFRIGFTISRIFNL